MASFVPVWSARHVVVLRRLRRKNLRRAGWTSAIDHPSGRNARRYDVAGSISAYVHAKRAAMGPAGRARRMPRDRAERFSGGGQGLARDVAGVLRAGIIRPALSHHPLAADPTTGL